MNVGCSGVGRGFDQVDTFGAHLFVLGHETRTGEGGERNRGWGGIEPQIRGISRISQMVEDGKKYTMLRPQRRRVLLPRLPRG